MRSYQEIYEAASALDADSIPVWVNYYNGVWTPAGQLASENHHQAVELLLKHGADPKDIAEGYAAAKNHIMVEEYRSKYPHSIDQIARGYARAGDHVNVEKYRTQYGASADCIAEGYAIAGDHVNVEMYRLQHHVHPDHIAKAYAQIGDDEHVAIYAHLGGKTGKIAEGYALAGNHLKVAEYVEQHDASISGVMMTYATVGEHEKVEAYCVQNPTMIDRIAKCYAQANNHVKVEEYRVKYGASLEGIVKGYALAFNHEKVIEIFMRKIIQEISDLKRSWFYDNTARVQALQTLHANLVSPSKQDKTLGGLMRRLDLPIQELVAENHLYFDNVLLHSPKPAHIKLQKYKDTVQRERGKEELSSTSSESVLDSTGALDDAEEVSKLDGLRRRK